MRIISRTQFWKHLFDYLPEWSEDQSGGAGSAGEDEDRVGEEYLEAQQDQDGQQHQPNPEGDQDDDNDRDGDRDDDHEESDGQSREGEPKNDEQELPKGDGDEGGQEDNDGPDEEPEEGEGPQEDSPEDEDQDEGKDESDNFGITGGDPAKGLPGYRLEIAADGSEDHIREFSSWWDFVQSANQADLRRYKKHFASHGSQFIGSFDRGTKDFQQAVDMALRIGWPEGRKLLDDQITTAVRQPRLVDHWSFDVAGAFPNVPMFCAGDPACMVIDPMNDLKQQVPIVRIDYNFVVSHITSIESIMTRGAAVVSLANNLERQGIQTELRIIGNQRGRDNKTFRISIVYKRAGEQLDLDRAAFAIAHPSVLRRLLLAIMEQHAEIEASMGDGYGWPLHEPNDPTSGQLGGAIFIRGAQYDETPTSARKAVEEAAQAVLGQPSDSERKAAA